MAENYDKLSPLGEQQARKLGEFWLRNGTRFHQVFQGPAERHLRTASIVAEVFADAGVPWPEPVTVPEMDEFDAVLLMRSLVPALTESHEPVRDLHGAFQQAAGTPEAGELLQRLFEEVARHWSRGTVHAAGMESWSAFRSRICRGIHHVRSATPKSSSSVVFTSGGPIAATVGLAHDLSPEKAIELVWVSRNSSCTEFLFSGSRFSLSTFNTHPHLDDQSLVTYR
jgi:broad specificity phosphatase PhoE